jgi:putative ABC transport system permease protein
LVGTDESTQKQYRVIGVDYDYIKTYGLKLITGRSFSKEFGSDKHSVIFNRKGIEHLGFNKPEEAIGKKIDFWGQQYTIEGVTENFHQQSLREAYEPLILRLIPDVNGYLSVKTTADKAGNTVALVKAAWNKFFPEMHLSIFSWMIILMNNIRRTSVSERCLVCSPVWHYWLPA